MKLFLTILKILQWVYAGAIGITALANGFHFSTLLLLLSAVLLVPLPAIRNYLRQKLKIKTWLAVVLAIVLFVAGANLSPLSEPQGSSVDFTYPTYLQETTSPSATSGTTAATEATVETTVATEAIETTAPAETTVETEPATKPTEKPAGVGNGVATPVSLKSIPAFSGKAYVVVNNNIPNFSEKELTTKGYETYSNLDSLGRTRTAVAAVGKDTMPKEGEERGSISSIKPSGWKQAKYSNISGGWLYNRCHLIGWQLSAENANRKNLLTGTKYLNIKGMLPFENMVADYIKETNGHVAYRITPIYDGNNLLASGVQMEAYSVDDQGEGICFNVFCYNVQPGVTIDYATGGSSGPAVEEETKAPTTAPTTQPVDDDTDSGEMVWIPKSGSKYHSNKSCSGMKGPSNVSKETAIDRGYEPCKKCY